MNSKQLTSVVNNINLTLIWSDFATENPNQVKAVEKYKGFKFLEKNEFEKSIESIKNFDINNVWNPKFWGLKKHESICAVATEIYKNINKIKSL